MTPRRPAKSVRASASTPSTSFSRLASASPIADMDAHQAIVSAALAAKSSAETPKKVVVKVARKPCVVLSHYVVQRLSYSSWRRHQTPVSLRPLGARSSHWYMPQMPSSPRA
jgi:hypothetical protein